MKAMMLKVQANIKQVYTINSTSITIETITRNKKESFTVERSYKSKKDELIALINKAINMGFIVLDIDIKE